MLLKLRLDRTIWHEIWYKLSAIVSNRALKSQPNTFHYIRTEQNINWHWQNLIQLQFVFNQNIILKYQQAAIQKRVCPPYKKQLNDTIHCPLRTINQICIEIVFGISCPNKSVLSQREANRFPSNFLLTTQERNDSIKKMKCLHHLFILILPWTHVAQLHFIVRA